MSTKTNKTAKMTPQESKLSASIMHAVEIESSFKLYSYRIITPEQYVNRIQELNQILITTFKSVKEKGSLPQDLEVDENGQMLIPQ